MENKVKELKLLSIAYQCAMEYDYCPEIDKASEIKENCFFAQLYKKEDIELACSLYCGQDGHEIIDQMIPLIDTM